MMIELITITQITSNKFPQKKKKLIIQIRLEFVFISLINQLPLYFIIYLIITSNLNYLSNKFFLILVYNDLFNEIIIIIINKALEKSSGVKKKKNNLSHSYLY